MCPIIAGILVMFSGIPLFDPLFAVAVGGWMIISTAMEVSHSHEEILWPEDSRGL